MTNETKPAPLQQGEYLPLPSQPYCHHYHINGGDEGTCYYTADQMRAYVDAHLAARGAAQAAPAEIDAKSFQSYAETRAYSKGYYAGKKAAQAAPADVRNLLDYAMQIAHERELHVTGHKHDSEGATASFIAACERAFGTSVQPAPASGEPVALRYRMHGDLQWQYTENPDQASHADVIQRLATTAQEARVPLTSQECRDMLEEVDPYNFAIDLIRAVEKHHGITAAQKEAP